MNLEEARLLLNPDASASMTKNPRTSLGQQQSQEGSKRKNDNPQGEGNKKKKGDNRYAPLYPVHTELNESRE